MAVFVKFWGTRGSIPTPGAGTRVHGGNTSCVEIRFGDTVFICDAGSGIRALGKDLLERDPVPRELHLLITHTHWDHIQGFPFFDPCHRKDLRINLYEPSGGDQSRHQLLSGQMSSAYFPVSFGDLRAEVVSHTLAAEGSDIGGVRIRSVPLNHPGGCFGFLFEGEGRRVAYLTDNEIVPAADDTMPDPEHQGKMRTIPPALVEVCAKADLLICDAQYDDAEYLRKKGWGHSSCSTVTDLAVRAGARSLALFHHDPESTDELVEERVESCRRRAARTESEVVIFAAREGVELKL
jgi:phosphoribosyl 1,2-cyclic phosphodiesterase